MTRPADVEDVLLPNRVMVPAEAQLQQHFQRGPVRFVQYEHRSWLYTPSMNSPMAEWPGGVFVFAAINCLGLEHLHEELEYYVVTGAPVRPHARLDTGRFESLDVVTAGLLNASIGMVNQPFSPTSFMSRR